MRMAPCVGGNGHRSHCRSPDASPSVNPGGADDYGRPPSAENGSERPRTDDRNLYVRVSVVGIELLTIDARIVIASVDTYLRFAEAVNRLNLSENGTKLTELQEGS